MLLREIVGKPHMHIASGTVRVPIPATAVDYSGVADVIIFHDEMGLPVSAWRARQRGPEAWAEQCHVGYAREVMRNSCVAVRLEPLQRQAGNVLGHPADLAYAIRKANGDTWAPQPSAKR